MKPHLVVHLSALGFGRALLAAGLGCALSALPMASLSAADPGGTGKLTDKEVAFLEDAGRGNVAEIQLAELALKNGQSPEVKTLALKTIRNRTAANARLSAVAGRNNVGFPPQVTAKEKAFYTRMAQLHGELFDDAYLKHTTLNNADDMAECRKAKGEVKDSRLEAYANRAEPMMEEHHQEAGGVKAEIDKKKK